MRHVFFCYIFLMFISPGRAQNEYSQWYFGEKAGLNFLTNPPSVLQNSSMVALEGCVSISDQAGNILFYSRGDSVFNHNHALMANGAGLFGNFSSSQSGLTFQRPGSSQQYYLFTMGLTSSTGLRYAIIDMSLAAGAGSVIVKNVPVYPHLSSEKLTGTRHCNGTDMWVLMHDSVNNFRAYLVNSAGLAGPAVVSSIGSSYLPPNGGHVYGCMKFSPNGKKLAVVLGAGSSSSSAKLELYDFDNSTGQLSNLVTFTSLATAYDCEFSPDGSKLYASTIAGPLQKLVQWDLCAGSPGAILASEYTVATNSSGGAMYGMQRAINGKIYLSRNGQNYLSVINNPNLSGSACNFVVQGQSVAPGVCNGGLPNFVSAVNKSYVTYFQDLGCNTVTFNPPPTVYTGTAGCSNVVNIVTGYQWNFGDPASGAANSSTLASPIHTYPGSGTYTIQLILTNNTCAPDTIRQTITLSSPSITVNSASVSCSGLSSATVNLLQGYSSSQASFTWNPGGLVGPTISDVSPGVYTITAGAEGGSCSITFTSLVIAPQQTVSAVINTTPSCTNALASVIVSGGSGNYNYTWTPGNASVSVVSNLPPGNYSVTVYDLVNLCSLTQTALVQSLSVPQVTLTGNLTICQGNTATLTALGADTYSWSNNSTASVIFVNPGATTIYTVVGTNTNNLCSDTETVMVTISSCLGLTESAEKNFLRLYPNPSNGLFQLELVEDSDITIYNLQGDLIYFARHRAGDQVMDLRRHQHNAYVLHARTKSGEVVKRIIVSD